MSNDDTGKQAGSYLDKPGNQGPTGRFFSFQYLAGLGRLSKKLGSRQVQVTRYLMIFKTELVWVGYKENIRYRVPVGAAGDSHW